MPIGDFRPPLDWIWSDAHGWQPGCRDQSGNGNHMLWIDEEKRQLRAEIERLRAALTEIRRIDQYRNPNVVSQDDAQDGPCAKIARAALAPVPPQDSGR